VVEDWLATINDYAEWAALTHGLAVPRQNGKNVCLEIVELYMAVVMGMKILHTAHQVKTARKHFRRLQYFFGKKTNDPNAAFPDLNAMVTEMRAVNGQEAIILDNGGSIEIIARSSASGRGFTVDVIVCDEAQDMSDEDQEALLSTAAAAPSGNPLWIYTGTPPGPKQSGEVFTRIRKQSLKQEEGDIRTWIEWSVDEQADPPVDIDDPEVWRAVNPGLDSGRLLWKIVTQEKKDLSQAGFCRERLGMWSLGGIIEAIPDNAWQMCADTESFPITRYSLGIWVSEDRSMAAVGFAGRRADDLWHVELDEGRPETGWVVEWVKQRVQKNRIVAVVLYSSSPAVSLVQDLEAEGVKVTQIGTTEMAGACASLRDGIVGTHDEQGKIKRAVRHTGQPQLGISLIQTKRKPALNGSGWVWAPRTDDGNTAPLGAVTCALWGAQAIKSKKVKRPGHRRRTGARRAVVR
jgi:hypothetical protein